MAAGVDHCALGSCKSPIAASSRIRQEIVADIASIDPNSPNADAIFKIFQKIDRLESLICTAEISELMGRSSCDSLCGRLRVLSFAESACFTGAAVMYVASRYFEVNLHRCDLSIAALGLLAHFISKYNDYSSIKDAKQREQLHLNSKHLAHRDFIHLTKLVLNRTHYKRSGLNGQVPWAKALRILQLLIADEKENQN